MPCNSVATVRTMLDVSLALVVGTDAGIHAAKVVIAQAAGVKVEAVQVYKRADYVSFSWGEYSNYMSVTIRSNGTIEVSNRYQRDANALKNKLAVSLKALAGLIAQARAAAAIGSKFQVVEQERAANGAIVMTVEI